MSSQSLSRILMVPLFRGWVVVGVFFNVSWVWADPHLVVHGSPRLSPDPFIPRYQAPGFVSTDMVATSLESVPGMSVQSSGGAGHMTTISFRGLSTGDTLVLLDGMPLNGGGSFGSFDFAHLLSGSVTSQALLPGANSVRYGDGATGGVILLETPFTSYTNGVAGEFGSFNTVDALASHQYQTSHQKWVTYLQGYRTSGLPQYGNSRMKGEKSTYKNGTFASAFKTRWGNKSMRLNARVIEADGQYDLEEPPLPASPQWTQRYGLASLSSVFKIHSGPMSHRVTTYVNQSRLKNTGDVLSKTTTLGAWYNGGIFWSDRTTSELIGEVKQSWFTKERMYRKGVFSSGFGGVQRVLLTSQWKAEMGARLNHHSHRMTPRPNYLMGTSYQWGDTLFLTNYRTAFKTPSFYNLYVRNAFALNNPNLKPENTQTIEIGFKHFLGGASSTLQVTQFWTTIKDMIHGTQVGSRRTSINLPGVSHSSGVESVLTWQVTPEWAIVPSYSYTQFKLGQAGLVTEFPRQKAALDTRYRLNSWLWAAQMVYASERRSLGFRLKPYTVVRADVEYMVTPAFRILGRVDNIFDKRYYHVYGYRHKGRAFYLGTSFRF